MRLEVRFATEEDIPQVAQLLADGYGGLGSERGGRVFLAREGVGTPGEDHLRTWLADADRCLVLGSVDGASLGLGLARTEQLRDGSRLARLEWLWVDPGVREIGLGAELMDLIVAWAREQGADRLDAYALPGNREAKNFLESAGFSARLIVMNRSLDAGEA